MRRFCLITGLLLLQGPASAEGNPLASYETRCRTLLENCSGHSDTWACEAMARLACGKPLSSEALNEGLAKVEARLDCADFEMCMLIRLLALFADDPNLPRELHARVKDAVLGFKFWPDEPGTDSMCYWSENHHILFAASGYVAGQMFPDEVFRNSGRTGREQAARFKPRVERWLEFRFRTGFSEWLSNVYYDESFAGVMLAADFGRDETVMRRAGMVATLMLADIALNSHTGIFGSTHGRSYEDNKKWTRRDATKGLYYLCCTEENPGRHGGLSATSLALSPGYRPPEILKKMAQTPVSFINRQRAGIRVADAKKWGLSTKKLDDGMTWLSLEAYNHPKIMPLMMDMLDAYDWWANDFYKDYKEHKTSLKIFRSVGLLPLLAKTCERDLTRNLREEVNIYTCRTPDYMLSTAQDWRKGFGGDQQHIWQATLGRDAVCFTTHPARNKGESPTYWTGSGLLPRAAQVGNVAVIIYKLRKYPAPYVPMDCPFTHAWVPRDKFDEVIEAEDGWLFARKGDGYLALRSARPCHWSEKPGEDQGREWIAPGKNNVWVCEMGRRVEDGPFDVFVARIRQAKTRFGRLSVKYESPSQGLIEFGWNGSLRRNGEAVNLRDYPRYDSPWVKADFPSDTISFVDGDKTVLTLKW